MTSTMTCEPTYSRTRAANFPTKRGTPRDANPYPTRGGMPEAKPEARRGPRNDLRGRATNPAPNAVQTLVPLSPQFSHEDAERLSALVAAGGGAASAPAPRRVVIDLRHAQEATTSAFARLVRLRRDLMLDGRDLLLAGLAGRAASLYEINRLAEVLPRQ